MRKFTWLSVLSVSVALLFISGSFHPCQAADACYKTKTGHDFRILVKPGDDCKKDESRITLSGGGGAPNLKFHECWYATDCGCDTGEVLYIGGAACQLTSQYLHASYGYSSDPARPDGWSAICYDTDTGAAESPAFIGIWCTEAP